MNQKIVLLFVVFLALPQFCILLWAIQSGFGFTYATISTLIVYMIALYHYNKAAKADTWTYITDPKHDYIYMSLIYLWPISIMFVCIGSINNYFGADIVKNNHHFILWIKSLPFPHAPATLDPSRSLDATAIYIFTLLVYICAVSVSLNVLLWRPISEAYMNSFTLKPDNRVWLVFVSVLMACILPFLYFSSAGYDFVSHFPSADEGFSHRHSYDRYLVTLSTDYILGAVFFPKFIFIIIGGYRYFLNRRDKI